MTNEMVKEQRKHTPGKTHELLRKNSVEEPDKTKARHRQFLALLKNQYGYTNTKAVDELERLLKMFYTMNKSLGIRRAKTNFKHPRALALKQNVQKKIMVHTNRKGENNEKGSGFVD